MKYFTIILLLSLLLTSVACSSQLTVGNARVAVLKWSKEARYHPPGGGTGTDALSAEEVKNNTGEIVIKGIQELPQDNSANADLEFSNFKYKSSGREIPYSGNGIATFVRYNDGTYVLKKVSIPNGKTWDNLNIEAK